MDQLLLQPDFEHGELRGQLTFNPHRIPQRGLAPARLQAEVVALVRRSITLEVDGRPCRPRLEVRELWEPASPTVGDILVMRCALTARAKSLRVYAAATLRALVVSVEGGPAGSRSVLLGADSWTPAYAFASHDLPAWRPGGAEQYANGSPQPSPTLAAPGTSSALPVATSLSTRPASAPSLSTSAALSATPANASGFAQDSWGRQLRRYLAFGYRHILPDGWDHVLFIVGLVLGARGRLKRLLWQVSAFTLAHTLTLGLGALGWLALPSSVVEPVIALSIAYVALENLLPERRPRLRTLAVFGFGLVHGLGFASALQGHGLARGQLLTALLSFNLGVELGQLSIVAALLLAFRLLRAERVEVWALRAGSVLIACFGLFWGFERLLS